MRVPNLPNPRQKRDIVKWWERRPFAYNLLVVGIGFVSYNVFCQILTSHTSPQMHNSGGPWYYLEVGCSVVVVINICYTAGWVVDAALFLFGFRSRRIGSALMFTGLLISLVAVTFPKLAEAFLPDP